MIYQLLKLIVGIGIRFYYRKVEVKNRAFLEQTGPTIIIANHPNTLMDAWMIGHVCKQPIYFMAKATLFDSPLKMKILRALKMIPINRMGEKSIAGVSNSASFEACYEILEKGKTLVIFPEGSSYLERQLRDLKSGAARIALEVEKRGKAKEAVRIVPVGLNYWKAQKFRSKVYVHVGQPIIVKNLEGEFKESPGSASKKLTEQFRISLERLLVNSPTRIEEVMIDEIVSMIRSRYRKSDGYKDEMDLLKLVRDRLDELNLTEAYKVQEIEELVLQIKWEREKYKIKTDFLDRRFRSGMFFRQLFFSILFALIAFPVFVYGLIHNLFQYVFTDWLIPKLTKEIEYYAPMSVLIGLVLYPIVYTLFLYLVGHFTDSLFWKLLYFVSLPISGLFAYVFYRYLQHIGYKWKYIFLMFNHREGMKSLKEKRDCLLSYFVDL